MLLQIGPLLRSGSKCFYGWDFYYAWVQMLLQMGPLLHLGPIRSNHYTCAFYSSKGCTDLESFTATSAVRYKSQTSPLQKC